MAYNPAMPADPPLHLQNIQPASHSRISCQDKPFWAAVGDFSMVAATAARKEGKNYGARNDPPLPSRGQTRRERAPVGGRFNRLLAQTAGRRRFSDNPEDSR